MTVYTAPATRQVAKVRPSGVAILSILYFLSALLTIIGGALAYGILSIFGPIGIALGTVVGGVLIVIGLVQMVVVWGLWTGRGWARLLAILFTILGLIPDLIGSLTLNPLSIVGFIIGVIILWYLFQPQARAFYA
jgi:hypothetical protein